MQFAMKLSQLRMGEISSSSEARCELRRETCVCVCDGNEFHSFSFQRVNVLWNCSRIKANGFLWKLYRKSAFKLFTSINKSRRNNVSQANKVIVFCEILRRSFSVFRELLRQINVACVLLKTTLNRFTSDKLFLAKTHF